VATRTLNVQITGDARGINRVLDQTESRSRRWGSSMAKGFAVAGAAAAGGLAVGLKKSADAAIEAEKAQATMIAQLRASNISYGAHARQIDEVIQKHSKLSGLDDEDLQRSFTNIIRVTGDVDKSLRLTGLAADFARAKHMDVAKAGELVGKVAGGNTGILSRYGIQVEKNATASEALALLQRKFAGQAEAYGKTTAGALDRSKVASENLGEIVGAKLTPLLAKGANALVSLVDAAGKLGGPFRQASGTVANAIRNIIDWVQRFRKRNKEDIDGVIDALKNLARFAKSVFSTIIDVIRPVLPHTKRILEGVIQVIRGLVRIVTGIINGDWSRVWDGAKDIVGGALRALKAVITGSFAFLKAAVKELGGRLVKALGSALSGLWTTIRDAIKSGVKKGIDAAKGAITGLIGSLNPFGDGMGRIGDGIGRGLGKTFGGAGPVSSLDGANPALRPIAAVASGFGVRVSSGLRGGAITSSGNASFHSSGEALDMSNAPHPTPQMMAAAKAIERRFGPNLAELIYSPLGYSIIDGQRTRPVAVSDHYDHVHAAVDLGRPGVGVGDGRGRIARQGDGPGPRKIAAIADAAKDFGISPAILWGVYGAETNFGQIKSNSSAGAQGPFQFMPATARAYGVNPHNFFSAVRGAAKYLSQYKSRGVAGMLAAYNAGPAGNPNNAETQAYIPKVISLSRTWPGVTRGRRGAGGGGGGGGTRRTGAAGGGGSGAAGGSATGTTQERRFGPGMGGYEQQVATTERWNATARRKDNLPALMLGLQTERKIKRRRLKRIARLLKKRLTRSTRIALINEATQLEDEIGELNATIKELRADMKGGAQTMEQAEAMEAGVMPADTDTGGDVGGGGEAGPDPAIAAAEAAAEADRQMKASLDALRQELEATRKFGERVQATENFQLKKYLADVISGQIGGYGVAGRAFTAGSGVEHAY
jgi:hypothetical protein